MLYVQGIEKSNLKKGNNIIVRWLQSSTNLKKKLRIVFHETKFILTQFDKGSRKETSDANRQTVILEYLKTFSSATSLGFYPFDGASKELQHALQLGDSLINDENFPSMLLLMKIIQNLYKPSKTMNNSPAIDFLNKVYWSGLLAKSKDGSKPKLNNMLQTFYRLAMD